MNEHGEYVELGKLEPAARVRASLSTAADMIGDAIALAHRHYGATVQGVSVNETLVDLYRELGQTEAAARNALNALTVLTSGKPEIRQAPAPERKDFGRPYRERST